MRSAHELYSGEKMERNFMTRLEERAGAESDEEEKSEEEYSEEEGEYTEED